MNIPELTAELERLHCSSFGWALSCCRRDREEAEEVLQASYLKLLEGRARFDGRASLKTFLFGVIRRTASEQRRRPALQFLLLHRSKGSGEPQVAPAAPAPQD